MFHLYIWIFVFVFVYFRNLSYYHKYDGRARALQYQQATHNILQEGHEFNASGIVQYQCWTGLRGAARIALRFSPWSISSSTSPTTALRAENLTLSAHTGMHSPLEVEA